MQTDPFEEYRSLLFAMAYRMLGSAMEAEDIVQEAYLRYRATPPESIRSLKSYLTTIVHNLCMDHLRSAQVFDHRVDHPFADRLRRGLIDEEAARAWDPLGIPSEDFDAGRLGLTHGVGDDVA